MWRRGEKGSSFLPGCFPTPSTSTKVISEKNLHTQTHRPLHPYEEKKILKKKIQGCTHISNAASAKKKLKEKEVKSPEAAAARHSQHPHATGRPLRAPSSHPGAGKTTRVGPASQPRDHRVRGLGRLARPAAAAAASPARGGRRSPRGARAVSCGGGGGWLRSRVEFRNGMRTARPDLGSRSISYPAREGKSAEPGETLCSSRTTHQRCTGSACQAALPRGVPRAHADTRARGAAGAILDARPWPRAPKSPRPGEGAGDGKDLPCSLATMKFAVS